VKLLFELSGECESLAISEIAGASAALGGSVKDALVEPGVLVSEVGCDPALLLQRLALCHHVSEWFCSCPPEEIGNAVADIDVLGPICVRSTRIGDSHRELDLAETSRSVGTIIGGGRGVDLESPRSEIRVVVSDSVHVGRLLGSVDRSSFEARKNQNMPFSQPISLHPKFARALVNLTGLPFGGRLLDPFCGTGAIIAEGALVGLDAVGTDLSEKMIDGAKQNLNHMGLSAEFHRCDVGMIESCVKDIDAVATDPPYGRSTSTDGEDVGDLIGRALAAFAEILDRGSGVAIVLPEVSFLDSCDAFTVREIHSLWVHRSLTRHFVILQRD